MEGLTIIGRCRVGGARLMVTCPAAFCRFRGGAHPNAFRRKVDACDFSERGCAWQEKTQSVVVVLHIDALPEVEAAALPGGNTLRSDSMILRIKFDAHIRAAERLCRKQR
jgi:hypothetical protein